MMINILVVILIIWAIITCFYIGYRTIKYKKTIDEKNIQLLQLYLDSKFMSKLLIDSLKSSHSKNFCQGLIEQIRLYYHLDAVIIIDSVRKINEVNKISVTQTNIQFTKEDIEPMMSKLNEHDIKEFQVKIVERVYNVYMSKLLSKEQCGGVVIAVESTTSLLNKNEKLGLENVLNLLKNRLCYS